jgi:hypothetical protein
MFWLGAANQQLGTFGGVDIPFFRTVGALFV